MFHMAFIWAARFPLMGLYQNEDIVHSHSKYQEWNYLKRFYKLQCQILGTPLHLLKIIEGETQKHIQIKVATYCINKSHKEVSEFSFWKSRKVQHIQSTYQVLLQLNTYFNDDQGCWNTNKAKQSH
jgi:hypothetical protein